MMLIHSIIALLSLTAAGLPGVQTDTAQQQTAPPSQLYEVVKVVDGDTIHIMRAGKKEKLRLLSVDTEERLSGRGGSATKPETVFGEECALWAQEFFAAFAKEGGPPHIGLAFPDGLEERDVYGRLLCHVLLPDGRDFNLMLVELGKSPYFNKYGNSRICHAEFVAAQVQARAAKIGIWNPATNRPKDDEAPAAIRPYGRLLPWWQARADAIDSFRERVKEDPLGLVAADQADALEAASAGEKKEVEVFGQIYRIFNEDDGSRTVLFRASDKYRALRVIIPKSDVSAHGVLDLDASLDEFRQNYLYVRGALKKGERGFELTTVGAKAWRRAGLEPAASER